MKAVVTTRRVTKRRHADRTGIKHRGIRKQQRSSVVSSARKKTQNLGSNKLGVSKNSTFPLRVPNSAQVISFSDDDNDTARGAFSKRLPSSLPEETAPTTSSALLTNATFESIVWSDKNQRLNPYLIKRLTQEGYRYMTAVQREAIPSLLQGSDMMIRSQTGSGKTLAFVVPAIQLLLTLESGGEPLRRADGTRVLLLAPTRELVNQTIALTVKLTIPFPQIVVTSITGGEKRKSEKARLRKGVTFLGCTVGRLCDHLDTTASLVIHRLALLVLDEADRLLDMGFEKKLRWIVNRLRSFQSQYAEADALRQEARGAVLTSQTTPESIQSVLVSATLTPAVQQLAKFVLTSERVAWVGENIATEEQAEVLSMPKHLKQFYVEITLKTRLALLMSILLDKTQTGKVVVFLSNCESVEFHHLIAVAARWPTTKTFRQKSMDGPVRNHKRLLRMSEIDSDESSSCDSEHEMAYDDKRRTLEKKKQLEGHLGELVLSGIGVYKLHGNLPQADRYVTKSDFMGSMRSSRSLGYLKDFNRATSHAVLFTTDVASRGLNIEGVSWIIQVDPPQEVAEYVHRSGRTARFGGEGNALLFLLEHELSYLDHLREKGVVPQSIPELQLLQPLAQTHIPTELREHRLQNVASFLCASLCRQVEADIDLLHSARRSFTSSYRAYRCYPQAFKKFFGANKLHLGHLAAAFALKESPAVIGEKCRQGVLAAAARSLRKRRDTQATPSKRFANVAGGVVHDPKKTSLQITKGLGRLARRKARLQPKHGASDAPIAEVKLSKSSVTAKRDPVAVAMAHLKSSRGSSPGIRLE